MKFVQIRAESDDADAPPIEVFAVLDSTGRISEDHPAFGRWGKSKDDFFPFEFSSGIMDFGSESVPRYYDFDLNYAPVKEGRTLTYSAREYAEASKTYTISRIRQLAL